MIEGRAFVPALWPVEVGNVFLTATRRGRIAADEWPRICASLEALPIEIEPISTTRAWGAALELTREHRLSGYDATYLELAVRMQLPWPRWIRPSAPPHGPKGWTCWRAPDLGWGRRAGMRPPEPGRALSGTGLSRVEGECQKFRVWAALVGPSRTDRTWSL